MPRLVEPRHGTCADRCEGEAPRHQACGDGGEERGLASAGQAGDADPHHRGREERYLSRSEFLQLAAKPVEKAHFRSMSSIL